MFCSRKCSNSRGPRTEEFKEKVSAKLKGRQVQSIDAMRKGILAKGQTVRFDLPHTKCVICGKTTNTTHRKTCSMSCYSELCKINSQSNINCGGQKHTHRTTITNIDGESFVAESSFEVRLSNILNELQIKWVRPSCFWYSDKNGKRRRYYPDFYLPDHDLYLDPKNSHLIKTDIDKIHRTSMENNIKIVILGEKFITRDTIVMLVGDEGNAPPLPACKTGTLLLS